MGAGLSHWLSMVLRKSQMCFSDRHTHPNSMYSNFCHVVKKNKNENMILLIRNFVDVFFKDLFRLLWLSADVKSKIN